MKKPAKERPAKKQSKMLDTFEADGTWTTVDTLGRAEPTIQAFEKGMDVTHEVVVKKLNEILASRGKKGTSIAEQLALLFQVEEKIGKY